MEFLTLNHDPISFLKLTCLLSGLDARFATFHLKAHLRIFAAAFYLRPINTAQNGFLGVLVQGSFKALNYKSVKMMRWSKRYLTGVKYSQKDGLATGIKFNSNVIQCFSTPTEASVIFMCRLYHNDRHKIRVFIE